MDKLKQPVYAIINNGIFGFTFMAGIVTGFKYTEDEPKYEVSFGKNSVWTSQIATSEEELLKLINLPSLERVKESHNLTIKFS